jgi:dephospho-CoA kinase
LLILRFPLLFARFGNDPVILLTHPPAVRGNRLMSRQRAFSRPLGGYVKRLEAQK